MLSINYMGRFGNQLFEYATLYATSKRLGFLISSGVWEGAHVFDLPPEEEAVASKYKFLEKGLHTPEHQTLGTAEATYQELLNISDETQLEGFFQSEIYFKDYREDLLKIFTLKDSLNILVEKRLSSFDKKPIVCIHHRAITGKTGPFDTEFTCVVGDEYYKKALTELYARTGLSSDDFNYLLISNDPSANVLSFLPNLVRSTHVFADPEPGVTNLANIIDLFLMANADHCITAASSFSWWGAWLNQKKSFIFTPKRFLNHNYQYPHFGSSEKPDNCICKNWISID